MDPMGFDTMGYGPMTFSAGKGNSIIPMGRYGKERYQQRFLRDLLLPVSIVQALLWEGMILTFVLLDAV